MRTFVAGLIFAASFATAASAQTPSTTFVDELDLKQVRQGWGEPRRNLSVDGNPLSIGGRKFTRGLGTHAQSTLLVDLRGSRQFEALVGVDDEVKKQGSVVFEVWAGTRRLWTSPLMRGGDEPVPVLLHLDPEKMGTLALVVTNGGDGINYDHANWAEARFHWFNDPPRAVVVRREPYILTPKPPAEPRVNGAPVFGVRPGSPFLYTIPATGERPMTFRADNLPQGLRLDAKTGLITGCVQEPGTHEVVLHAQNARGEAVRPLRVVVGDKISLTPPMGFNSWNCWAHEVSDAKIRATAEAMVATGLVNHGWTYVNIDDCWQGKRGGEWNAIQPNARFPDMAALADHVHGLGLKLGIYSTPWITSYAGFVGGSSDDEAGKWEKAVHGLGGKHYWKNRRHGKHKFDVGDAKQWAAWGIDYLKYDWGPNEVVSIERMASALEASGRDIVYSLSNTAPFKLAAPLAKRANLWRTTGDIRDDWDNGNSTGTGGWQGIRDIWRYHPKWAKFNGPGHWNDPDMMVVGHVGWGKLRPTRLTPDEQYTHVSLWCLWSAPLLLGCPIEKLDEFTLSLLSNDEVLAVNQDALGLQAVKVAESGFGEVIGKNLADGSRAAGLFNKGPLEGEISMQWSDIGDTGPFRVRDLWRQQDLGVFESGFTAKVPAHGVVLLRLIPVKAAPQKNAR